jgi:hypothetical protein
MGGELGAAARRGRLAISRKERGGLGYGRLVAALRELGTLGSVIATLIERGAV